MIAKQDNQGIITAIEGSLCRVQGLAASPIGSRVRAECGSIGQILQIGEQEHTIGFMQIGDGVMFGKQVSEYQDEYTVPVGKEVLGRVINALGEPLDGGSLIRTSEYSPVIQEAYGVNERERLEDQLISGTSIVDTLIPLAKGQRELIVGDKKSGKSAFLHTLLLSHAQAGGICVYVLVGKSYKEAKELISLFRKAEKLDHIVVVVAAGSDPIMQQVNAPFAGCAIAEQFWNKNKHVVIAYDDLTNHAYAYREMQLAMGRMPTRESYPADIFSIHAGLLERSGRVRQRHNTGSLTALPVSETVNGELSAFITTNLMSITDGHIFFELDRFNQGIKPAIHPSLSVTRVGRSTQPAYTRRLAGEIRAMLSKYTASVSLTQFGSHLTDVTRQLHHQGAWIEQSFHQLVGEVVRPLEQLTMYYGIYFGHTETIDPAKCQDARELIAKGTKKMTYESYGDILGRSKIVKIDLLEELWEKIKKNLGEHAA